ncbi:sensor histidine kinase [Streptomyces minutiscleroticus]|uniref:sensor histidine kinase n=1 Tax=Streptomyces minutiscleroticus TaxID=68238 RepID=UPI00167D0474|nr:nitrate- and nitrite sensing domain-containing protein [Streptomyces minutiscleroticus]
MRFRGKSIRRKIVALLLVPLVSLTAIWAFATVLTGREVQELYSVTYVVKKVGHPAEDVVRVLQDERRQSLVYLADPRASDALADLRRTRAATDEAVAAIRAGARNPEVRDQLGEGTGDRLTALLDALDGMPSLRRSVEGTAVTRSQALELYNQLVDPCFVLLSNLNVLEDVEMAKQGRILVNVSRARELLSREDALLGSALVTGRLTDQEQRDVSDLVAQRTLLYDISLPLLPSDEGVRYENYWKNASSGPLRAAEQDVATTDSGAPGSVTARGWDESAGTVLKDLAELDAQASDRYQDRVRPVAIGVIATAGVAGVLGLVAVLVALFISVRIGRGLIRALEQLRLEAHDASEVRLPAVMRRLSAGERVDVETEAPRLEYDRNEIGEVGRALNSLQRAAVEAAVGQAELRAGVSEVFVNLARRSQVLLHKQLALLDTMERRTEDTDELADLFRLDHLTTRMRRHAEGLVILSGAAPSRQWRRPVQLMDVVRAAVAEVEDYERIEVRRLPRVAVAGPSVADLTHLVAELLENATVFSPPHTAVQVVGERVANGFTLEIHDRGLGMAADAMLDANLRLAETSEFELSDTDRLGLFVVSRLARRQNVRVSLQPSPYGGTTAVVFVPEALLTDDEPDTNGAGFRLDRVLPGKDGGDHRRPAPPVSAPVELPGPPASILDGPVVPGPRTGPDALDGLPGAPGDGDGGRGVLRPRRPAGGVPAEQHGQADAAGEERTRPGGTARQDGLAPLPRRRTPKLVSSNGRPVNRTRPRRNVAEEPEAVRGRSLEPEEPRRTEAPRGTGTDGPRGTGGSEGPDGPGAAAGERADGRPQGGRPAPGPAAGGTGGPAGSLPRRLRDDEARRTADAPGPDGSAAPARDGAPAPGGLPRRVRQANLAPQLKDDRRNRHEAARTAGADVTERDADEVRSRMASLQRGWQRGREENAAGDDARRHGTAQRTTEGDGR